jgi:hypothetical protein
MKAFGYLATLTLSIVGLVQHTQAAGTCFGLAMNGGDQNAAFQAGAIQALIKNLPADQV